MTLVEYMSAASTVLYVLGGLIGTGFAVLLALRARNDRLEAARAYYLSKHQDYFTYVSAHIGQEEPLRPPAGPLDPLELRTIGQKLLEWIEGLEGEHRAKLTELCRNLGLIELELGRLRSFWHWTRIDAAYRLGAMRASEAVPDLLRLLKKEADDSTAFVVARAVAKCASRPEELREMLELMLARRRGCRQLMADILASSSVDAMPLYRELLDSGDEERIALALVALRSRSEPSVAASLNRLVRSGSKDIRIKAAKILLQHPELLPAGQIAEFLHHGDWEIRAAAAKAVGLLGLPDYIGDLAAALDDSSWWVRYYSARSLIALGAAGVQALCEAARLEEDSVSRRAAWDAIHEEMNRASAQAADIPTMIRNNRLSHLLRKKHIS